MFNARQISNLVSADIVGKEPHGQIDEIRIDSRLVSRPECTLFICLKGKRTDGHHFIPELIKSGVKNFVVTDTEYLPEPHDATFFLVKEAVAALQSLAAAHRQALKGEVLAITGSNGKTIVKEWLYHLLKPGINVYRSPGSFNSQIGVPLSILGIPEDADLAIIEAGISKSGEMSRHQTTIQPDFGIITNIGDAHDKGFPDRSEKQREKLRLMTSCRWWLGHDLYEPTEMDNARLWSVQKEKVEGDIDQVVEWEDSHIKWNGHRIKCPFTDRASLQNLTHCLLFIEKRYPELLEVALEHVSSLQRVAMRTEMRRGIRNCSIISDYYNSDLESLSNLLDMAEQLSTGSEKVFILSEFMDIDMDDKVLLQVASLINESRFDRVFLIGKSWPVDVKSIIPAVSFIGETTEALIESGRIADLKDSLIVLKGARAYHFEDIEKKLLRPVYGTRLNIDLEALSHNFSTLKSMLDDKVKSMVMVKASAYGSGAHHLAKFFEDNAVDYLGVAYANEGVELREAGIKRPILVMNAEPGSWEIMKSYDLEPEIHGVSHLKEFISEMDHGQSMTIHIKCETGMNRLGFESDEIGVLRELLRENAYRLHVASIFTHLSSSDLSGQDDFTRGQLATFDKMYDSICETLGYRPLKHAANSASMIRFPESHYDMVRMGIALYGCGIENGKDLGLHPVHSLLSYVVQVKERIPGDTIGYGRTGKIDKRSLIATVPVGYADGIPRSLGNGKLQVRVNGKTAPTIGHICMDMMMIDVSAIPGIKAGDNVEIFGPNLSIDRLAENAGTIAYEILVRIGARVERVFTRA